MKRVVIIVTAAALTLTGCAATDSGSDPAPENTVVAGANSDNQATFLATHDLEGKSVEEIINHLDQLPMTERPKDLMASVRIDELQLSDAESETVLDMPTDKTYVSIAPYVNQTHDCFYHSLTTCTGELGNEEVHVVFREKHTGEAIIDDNITTYDNGFVGFWAPKGVDGTIEVDYDGKTATSEFSTGAEGATCVTTLKLA